MLVGNASAAAVRIVAVDSPTNPQVAMTATVNTYAASPSVLMTASVARAG